MCNSLYSVICVMWFDDDRKGEGETRNPVPDHSLLFSKSTKGAARLNVPIRRTNRYQQYYMTSQHTYCGRVWNSIQACDVQSSDQKVYIFTPPAPRLKVFKWKFTISPGSNPGPAITRGRHGTTEPARLGLLCTKEQKYCIVK